MNKLLKRTIYLKRILPYVDKSIVKVITGQRRVGKSYIMLLIVEELKQRKVKKEQIIYINKEDLSYEFIKDHTDLAKYVESRIKDIKLKYQKIYLFIDEVQEIKTFEKAIRSFLLNDKFDIYLTGSNSSIVSSEIATYLSGRYIEFRIYPLNYKEFLKFSGLDNSNKTLLMYMRYGGLPFLRNLELVDEVIFNYLKNIYNTILLQDVVKRFDIRNVNFMESLVKYIADTTGALLSANSIANFLKQERSSISPNIVLDYLSALKSAYFIDDIKRYDIRGKKLLKLNSKYYLNDIGIRNAISGFRETDQGKLFENIVLTHLLSNGYQVWVGNLQDLEIDFVVEKNNEIKYIQVAYKISSEATKKREFGNLLLIKDNYEKLVVSGEENIANYRGIKHLNILDFLIKYK
ncbi:MAG: ATP-binding protein [bacterium]